DRDTCCDTACFYFVANDLATTQIYTLSLHDALPISRRLTISTSRSITRRPRRPPPPPAPRLRRRRPNTRAAARSSGPLARHSPGDRKSTRLNSSHVKISYAVSCLKTIMTKLLLSQHR